LIASLAHTSLCYVVACAPTNAMPARSPRAMEHQVGCDTRIGVGLLTVDNPGGEAACLAKGDQAALGPRVTIVGGMPAKAIQNIPESDV
jgi:hypothetical protein